MKYQNEAKAIIEEGFKSLNILNSNSSFTSCCEMLGCKINIIPNTDNVKDGRLGCGLDSTQYCINENKIDIAEYYITSEPGINTFSDSAGWSIHELFHAWIGTEFKGAKHSKELFEKYNNCKKIVDAKYHYPLNFDEWIAYGAQFAYGRLRQMKYKENVLMGKKKLATWSVETEDKYNQLIRFGETIDLSNCF